MNIKSSIHHFPVGNGDMTLIKIASNDQYFYVLIDMNIRKNSQEKDDQCNVLEKLHELLDTDDEDHPYIDVLLLSHPDEDHIRGFKDCFHTGLPDSYVEPKEGEKGKIFIREIWSSPLIFRRKSKNHTLCKDAQSFNTEAKRRVKLFKENQKIGEEGNRIRLIGQDIDGKTDDILDIVYEREDTISTINEQHVKELKALVLAPLDDDDFDDSEAVDKNRSSVVIQWKIASHGQTTPNNYVLLGGDACVEAWEVLWGKYQYDLDNLKYDILLAPHHCSWHTLSHDSYSKNDDPQVSDDALSALSQAKSGAVILASSETIEDNENDPPNYGAMNEYKDIVSAKSGVFKCLADNIPQGKESPAVLEFQLTSNGPVEVKARSGSKRRTRSVSERTAATGALFSSAGEAIGHG